MKHAYILPAIIAASLAASCGSQNKSFMTSPDGSLSLEFNQDSLLIEVDHNGARALSLSANGIVTSATGNKLTVEKIGEATTVTDSYEMLTGKRKACSNEAVERVIFMKDSAGNAQNLRMRLYNDGVAFRYEFPDLKDAKLVEEQTVYTIPEGTPRWIADYEPSYERYFPKSTTGVDSVKTAWSYPALLNPADSTWVLITEANIERRQSASWLDNAASSESYKVIPGENNLSLNGEWHTPWRTAIIGNLEDIVESTLVTDLSEPSKVADTSWIHPGKSSWIYWAYNHGSKDYKIVKQFIDMGKTLNLPYILIDWEWDVMENGGDIKDALAYAHEQGLKPLLWYNSSTGWITEWNGPHYRLNDPEKRQQEFKWLNDNGVAGIKVDFFDGDKQAAMDYSIDILEDAADHKVLVDLHGATLPRGWQRTYPNLMTTEGVLGAEWYNNNAKLTPRAAAHNTTLPFTRNVVGSMDYTPVTFSDSQHPHITSNAHELALAVVFESGLQNFADKPESYLSQPQEVQDFLSTVPNVWDNTRLLGGYPGEYVALAREKDGVWYVGVLNGSDEAKTLNIDWNKIGLGGKQSAEVFADGENAETPWNIYTIAGELPTSLECQPRGGYVFVITPAV